MKGKKGKTHHAKAFEGKETVAEEAAEERAIKKAHSVKGAMTKARLDKKARGGHVKKFIQHAIKHPGRETKRAKEHGISVHEQMVRDSHSKDPSLRGAGQLGLRFQKGEFRKHKK